MNFLTNFMRNRYGKDLLSISLLIAGAAMAILANIFGLWFLALIATLSVVVAVFRMLSTNIAARHRENQKFVWAVDRVKKFFVNALKPIRKMIFRLKDDEHCYFRCPDCRQEMRVPTGRGKILITCPKCGKQFTKKT